MAQSTLWWLLAGIVVSIELVTGTFYLLMLAVGLAAAAVSAHMGAGFSLQLTVAACISAATVLGWRQFKKAQPTSPPASSNPDVNLDIGEIVHIEAWNPDGTSTVKYRGANWAVSSASDQPLAVGSHQVVEVVGSRLIVRKL